MVSFIQIMHIWKSAKWPVSCSQRCSAVSLISENPLLTYYWHCCPYRHNCFSSVWTGIMSFASLLLVCSSIYLNVLLKPSELKNFPSCCQSNICHALLAFLIFQLVLRPRWLNKFDLHFWDNLQITDVWFSSDLLSNHVRGSSFFGINFSSDFLCLWAEDFFQYIMNDKIWHSPTTHKHKWLLKLIPKSFSLNKDFVRLGLDDMEAKAKNRCWWCKDERRRGMSRQSGLEGGQGETYEVENKQSRCKE